MRLSATTRRLKNLTSSIKYHVDHVLLQLVGLFMFKEAMPRKNFVFRKYLQTSLDFFWRKKKTHPVATYCKVESSNTSRLKAHAGFSRLLIKRIFDPCVL